MAGKLELKLQSQCFQWHWNTYPAERQMLFRVKNELDNFPGKKDKKDIFAQLSENKATGVIKGVSDVVYQLPGVVAYIELKTEEDGSRQSEEQKAFEAKVKARGMLYFVVRNLEQFKALIVDLLKQHNNEI